MGDNPKRNIWDLFDDVKKDVSSENQEKVGSECGGDKEVKGEGEGEEPVLSASSRTSPKSKKPLSARKQSPKTRKSSRASARRRKVRIPREEKSESCDSSDSLGKNTMEKSSTVHKPFVIPDLSLASLKSRLKLRPSSATADSQHSLHNPETDLRNEPPGPKPAKTDCSGSSGNSSPLLPEEDTPLDLSNNKRKAEPVCKSQELPEVPLDLSVKKSLPSSVRNRGSTLLTTSIHDRGIKISPVKPDTLCSSPGLGNKERQTGLFENILGKKHARRVSPVRPHMYGRPVGDSDCPEQHVTRSHTVSGSDNQRIITGVSRYQNSMPSSSSVASPVGNGTIAAGQSLLKHGIGVPTPSAKSFMVNPTCQAQVTYASTMPLRVNIPPKPVPMAQVRPNNSAIQTLSPGQSYSAPVTTVTVTTVTVTTTCCVPQLSTPPPVDAKKQLISTAMAGLHSSALLSTSTNDCIIISETDEKCELQEQKNIAVTGKFVKLVTPSPLKKKPPTEIILVRNMKPPCDPDEPQKTITNDSDTRVLPPINSEELPQAKNSLPDTAAPVLTTVSKSSLVTMQSSPGVTTCASSSVCSNNTSEGPVQTGLSSTFQIYNSPVNSKGLNNQPHVSAVTVKSNTALTCETLVQAESSPRASLQSSEQLPSSMMVEAREASQQSEVFVSPSDTNTNPKLAAFIPLASSEKQHSAEEESFYSNIAHGYKRKQARKSLTGFVRLCQEIGQAAPPPVKCSSSPKPSKNVIRSGQFDFKPISGETWRDHLKDYKTDKLRMPRRLIYIPRTVPVRFTIPGSSNEKDNISPQPSTFTRVIPECPVEGTIWKSKGAAPDLSPKKDKPTTKADLMMLMNRSKTAASKQKLQDQMKNVSPTKRSILTKKLKQKEEISLPLKARRQAKRLHQINKSWWSQYVPRYGAKSSFNPCFCGKFNANLVTLSNSNVQKALEALVSDGPPQLEKMTNTPPKPAYDYVYAPVLSPKRVKTPPRHDIPATPLTLNYNDPPRLEDLVVSNQSATKPKKTKQVAKKSTTRLHKKASNKSNNIASGPVNIVTIGDPVLIPISNITVNSVILLDSSEEEALSSVSSAPAPVDDDVTRCSSDDGFLMWDEEEPVVENYDDNDSFFCPKTPTASTANDASSFNDRDETEESRLQTLLTQPLGPGISSTKTAPLPTRKRRSKADQQIAKNSPKSIPSPKKSRSISSPKTPRSRTPLFHRSPQRSPSLMRSPRRAFPLHTSTPRGKSPCSSSSSSCDRSRGRKKRSMLDELANSDGYVAEKRTKHGDDLLVDPARLDREQRALQRAILQFSEMEVKQLVQRSQLGKPKAQTSTSWRANQLKRKAMMAPRRADLKRSTIRVKLGKESSSTVSPTWCNSSKPRSLPSQSTKTYEVRPSSVNIENTAVFSFPSEKPVKAPSRKKSVKQDIPSSSQDCYIYSFSTAELGTEVTPSKKRRSVSKKGGKKRRHGETLSPRLSVVPSAEAYVQSVDADGKSPDRHLKQLLLVPRDQTVDDDMRSIASTSTSSTRDFRGQVPTVVKRIALCHNTGETVLHKAARLGYEEVCLWCCQSGYVDPDAADNAGYTALHESAVYGHTRIAKYLLAHGVQVNVASRLDGVRPLLDAVQNSHMEVTRLLLSMGADPSLTTYSGKNAFSLARTKTMKQFLNGYLIDLNGPSANDNKEEFSWEFSPFREKWREESDDDDGDNGEEAAKEELGFDVLANSPEDDINGLADVELELFDEQPLETYSLCMDQSLGRQNYYILPELLATLGLTREEFLMTNSDVRLAEISREDFREQLTVLQRGSGETVLSKHSGETIDLVSSSPSIIASLNGEVFKMDSSMELQCRSSPRLIQSNNAPSPTQISLGNVEELKRDRMPSKASCDVDCCKQSTEKQDSDTTDSLEAKSAADESFASPSSFSGTIKENSQMSTETKLHSQHIKVIRAPSKTAFQHFLSDTKSPSSTLVTSSLPATKPAATVTAGSNTVTGQKSPMRIKLTSILRPLKTISVKADKIEDETPSDQNSK